MSIVKEFEARIEAEQVIGTYKWLQQWTWQEKNKLDKYITDNTKNIEETFSRRQQTMTYLCSHNFRSVLDIKELKIQLSELDEEEIKELISFYNLEKPAQTYKEIKTRINSPESFMTNIPYSVINELYKRKKVPFDRQIFVACIVRFNVWHGARYNKELPENAKNKLTSFFPTDEFTLDILMAVFEMELGASTAFYVDRDFNIGGLIIALVNLNILDREKVQLKMFESFNNPMLKQTTHGWIRNMHNDLAFSVDELMPHQNKFINLLQNDRNLLAIYGLKILKKLSQQADFNWSLFISNLEGIVYREKFNAGFNIALGMLQKLLKKEKKWANQCCINLAPIFLQPDHKTQLKAKAIFELASSNEDIIEALSPYVETMHTEVKRDLSEFILDEFQEENAMEIYEEKDYVYLALNDDDKVKYIDTEEDFIFLCSKVLKSQDFLDIELFLEAFPRYYYLNENPALNPAFKQAKRILPNIYPNITNKTGSHHLMIAKLICCWIDPKTNSFDKETKTWELELTKERAHVYTATQWLTYFKMISRIAYLANPIHAKKIPLLSIPSHHNGQIHPDVLLERLAQYEVNNILPNEGDFNTAISRLNRWTPFKQKTVSIKTNSEYRLVLDYLLNEDKSFDHQSIKNLENTWLTAYSIKNPDKAIDANLAYQLDKDWWKNEKTWTWEAGRRYSDNYSWATTNFNIEVAETGLKKDAFFGYNLVFFYSRIADIGHWFARDMFQTETLYLNICNKHFSYFNLEAENSKSVLATINYAVEHLNPIHKAGHIFLVLSLYCQDKSIRSGALDWLCQLIEHQMLDLNLFTNAAKKLLINKDHPIPTPRITEQFNELIALSGTYEYVAYHILKELLAEIDISNLPKGFSKILNHYYEVNQNTNDSCSEEIKLQLEKMTKISSVKKEAKKILKHFKFE